MKNIIFLFFVLFFISCDIINPDEQIPAYLKIEKINLDASPNFSSNSENIRDVWVFTNGTLLGAFELPCEIPVLAEGITDVKLIPGIFRDGIRSQHLTYPYYTGINTTVNFVPEESVVLSPTINYNDAYEEVFNEDFEGVSFQFENSTSSEAPFQPSEAIIIDGLKSGYILASEADKKMEIISKNEFQVITRTSPSYLEIDYLSSVEFSIGIITNNNIKNHELILRPNDSRTKIYIDISAEVGVFSLDTKFKIYFESISKKSGDYIVLDNIRLLIPSN